MILFEEILEREIGLLDEVEINTSLSRKPKFGWGNSDELRKVLEVYGEEHYPMVWCVPRQDSSTDFSGIYTRDMELNLCTRETRTELLNTVRTDANYSYQKVLLPLWNSIERQFELSGSVVVLEDTLRWQLFPDYKLGEQYETKEIWDVLKIIVGVQFNNEYVPCIS
ncbi:MAG: hypothetical protein AAF348_07505 [Bacteroidota bacterium]